MILVTSGMGYGGGGIQAVAQLSYEELARRGSVGVIQFGPTVERLPLSGPLLTSNSKTGLVARLLVRRWKAPQVLLMHVGLLKLIPLLRGRPRVALFVHGIEAWRRHGWLTRQLLDRVDLFLSISDYTWKRFLEVYPRLLGREHITIPLGLGEPMHGEIVPPADPPTALMLGRLSRSEDYKGHRELIAAWPQVLTRVPGARLEIAGDGDLRPELESLARERGVSRHVLFRGRVSERQKEESLESARCLALPSRGEGFGLVYLEAMRVGRPCLVSNQDAGREVVNPPETGLGVDPGDQGALVKAIVQLLTDGGLWRQQSVAARHRYETFFTAGHFQERLIKALFGAKVRDMG